MILNKGSHPVKHDRSSPRYVAVLLGSVAAAPSAFRRLRTAGHEPTFGTDIKVRPNLQCYRVLPHCVPVTFTNDDTLCRVSKLYLVNPQKHPRADGRNKVSRGALAIPTSKRKEKRKIFRMLENE